MAEINFRDLQGMKVSLVVPGLIRSKLYGEWDLSKVDSVSPPLGVLSLAAVLRSSKAKVSFCDAYARGLDTASTAGEILGNDPEVVAISCLSQSYPTAKELCREIRRRAPKVKLVIGGVHISAVGKKVLEEIPELDFGVLREGEVTLPELLDALRNGSALEDVNGIIYRRGKEIVETSPRGFIQNLDLLPMPAWDLLRPHLKAYRLSIVGTRGSRSMSLVTSRGCPGSCAFCDIGAVGGQIRAFSAGYVLEMIECLMRDYGIDDFLIYDDNFVTLKNRTRQICREIIGRKLKISWSCSARADMVDAETLQLMKQAGCWQIEYGIESGSQKILDSMCKHITPEKVRQALTITKKAGIETRGNFIFGYFGETRSTLEESIRFSLSLDLDYFQQTFLTPYPGSRIYSEADRFGAFDRDLEKMNNLTINFIPSGLTEEELRYFSRRAFRLFYSRPKTILHQFLRIRSFSDIGRLAKAGAAFLKTVKAPGKKSVTLDQVRTFWEKHPLLAYELPFEPGSEDFFRVYDRIREDQEFKYCFHLLGIEKLLVKAKVLDVGCGNGWLLSRYAEKNIPVFGIDLTRRSLEISSLRFARQNCRASLVNASAEDLPFSDDSFDLVTSLGVVHHTPRTEQCCREIVRVCKPGGRVLVAVYYENLLLRRWFYPLTRLFLGLLGRPDLLRLSRREFINHFDGPDNPLGKAYSVRQAKALLGGLRDVRSEIHYFPKRFVPGLAKNFPEWFNRFLDRNLGFLIYLEGYKKESQKCAE